MLKHHIDPREYFKDCCKHSNDTAVQNVLNLKDDGKETVLIMFSGGIDSIYILWDCLANTDMHVAAHHIILHNDEGRGDMEEIASRNIVKHLKATTREFEYSESLINRKGMPFYGFDMMSVGFEAGLAAQSYLYKFGRKVDYWQIGHYKGEHSWNGRWDHVDACCRASSFPFEPPKYREINLVDKAEQIRRLPSELVEMSWGCRTPMGDQPCGKCKTCAERQKAGLAI